MNKKHVDRWYQSLTYVKKPQRPSNMNHRTKFFLNTESRRRFVKKVSFFAGLLILGCVLLWLAAEKQNLKNQTLMPQKLVELHEMLNPVYTGQDEHGLPYVMKATKGKLLNPDDDVAILHIDLPWGEFFASPEVKIQLSGVEGLFDTGSRLLTLKGNVHFKTTDGYDFVTSSALLDLKAGTGRGDEPVEGMGPQGKIRSEGFRIKEKGAIVSFVGKAQAVITDHAQFNQK